jgi:hypothetical protein
VSGKAGDIRFAKVDDTAQGDELFAIDLTKHRHVAWSISIVKVAYNKDVACLGEPYFKFFSDGGNEICRDRIEIWPCRPRVIAVGDNAISQKRCRHNFHASEVKEADFGLAGNLGHTDKASEFSFAGQRSGQNAVGPELAHF